MNDMVEIQGKVDDGLLDEFSNDASLGEQYLSFTLGDETYAVEILAVQEIRTWEVPTLLPRSPDYMKGVINLRGTIVPVIDLRLRFSICEPVYDDTTVVIVLRIMEEAKVRIMGIVVDTMSDVLFIDPDSISTSPEFGGKVDAKYINGLTTVDGNIVSLLNTEAMLNINEIDHNVMV